MSSILRHSSPNKSARVNELREQEIMAGFNWRGGCFDIDSVSLMAITRRALRVTLDSSMPPVSWRTKDNETVTMTSEDFLLFATAADAHVEAIFKKSWELKDEVT